MLCAQSVKTLAAHIGLKSEEKCDLGKVHNLPQRLKSKILEIFSDEVFPIGPED